MDTIEPKVLRTEEFEHRRGHAKRIPNMRLPNPEGGDPITVVHVDWMTTGFMPRPDGDPHQIGITVADTKRCIGMVMYMAPEEALMVAEGLAKMAQPGWAEEQLKKAREAVDFDE